MIKLTERLNVTFINYWWTKGFHSESQVDQDKTLNEIAVHIDNLREISSSGDEINEGLKCHNQV